MNCNCSNIKATGRKECNPNFHQVMTPEMMEKVAIRESQLEWLYAEEQRKRRVLEYLNSKGFRVLNFN